MKNLARLMEEKNKLEGELNGLTTTRDENRNVINNIQQQNTFSWHKCDWIRQ